MGYVKMFIYELISLDKLEYALSAYVGRKLISSRSKVLSKSNCRRVLIASIKTFSVPTHSTYPKFGKDKK